MILCGHLFAEIVITIETKLQSILLLLINKSHLTKLYIMFLGLKGKQKKSQPSCNVPAVFGFIISKCLFLFPPHIFVFA